ncbi:hypothetical protein MKZ87_02390 [Pseudomonas sp. MCal1]|nr:MULTISPECIES: hypothetical protein [unclassified Pseudomonas]MCX4216475.1 hypothetical protein [Pseudomonas sp. MCal1]
MVIHFKVNGHLACGHKGNNLSSSSELNRVKCRSCRNTDAYKDARKEQRNAAPARGSPFQDCKTGT